MEKKAEYPGCGPLCLPSFIVRAAIIRGKIWVLNGIKQLTLCGKVLRRSGKILVIFDSFSGIPVHVPNLTAREEADRSIRENYLVKVQCRIIREGRTPRLEAFAIRRIGILEEIFRTLEGMEYWNQYMSFRFDRISG